MRLTIDQVKADIKSGKCQRIYYSSNTLWWTHRASDVQEATEQGKQTQETNLQRVLDDPNTPNDKKERVSALLKMTRGFKHQIPLDPTGSPLMQMDDCMKWVSVAEDKPDHFGKNGLDAFMKTHHQNCEGKCFTKWEEVNNG